MKENPYNKVLLKRYSRRVKLFDDEKLAKRVFTYIDRGTKSAHNYKLKSQNKSNKNSKEVLVKITGNSKNMEALKAHIDYITRKNKLEISVNEFENYQGREETEILKEIFKEEGSPIPSKEEVIGAEKREVLHITFSMKDHETTPPDKLKKAVMETVKKKYPNNLSAFVFHGDTDNPHIHTVLKIKDNEGKRIDVRKKDLAELRKGFAQELNNLGIEAYATIKRDYDRKDTKRHYYKVVEFGKAKFQFSTNEFAKDSYYVKYETTKGKYAHIWSNDLERVVRENNVKVGEFAKFKIVGKEPVTIEQKKKIKGKTVVIKKEAHKSVWDVSVKGREKDLKDPVRTKKTITYNLEYLRSRIAEFKKMKRAKEEKAKNKKSFKRDRSQEQERSR